MTSSSAETLVSIGELKTRGPRLPVTVPLGSIDPTGSIGPSTVSRIPNAHK